ncbi:MAG: PEP/pyruvate-binding domain-containing protein [Parcubacteria group bacterium]
MSKFILSFDKINKSSVSQAGGKGASLGEMVGAGFPVPPGFVVSAAAFDKYLADSDIGVEIESALDKVKSEDVESVEEAAEIIQHLIHQTKMDSDLQEEILAEYKKLSAQFVAVRSSATAEDSKIDSWAGELESYLDTTEDELLARVRDCWASLFTPRAIFYRFARKLEKSQISVAVVVQKMIESAVAGVAFSVHPITKDHNQLIIEAGWGLGESIVLGKITPDSYVIDKEKEEIIDLNISEQEKKIIRQGDKGGVKEVPVPASHKNKQKLSAEKIIELAQIVKKIEQHYCSPQDVEWAYAAGKFYVVQSRPITTL